MGMTMEKNPWLPILAVSEQSAKYWRDKLFADHEHRTYAAQWTELWEGYLTMSELAREAARRWDE